MIKSCMCGKKGLRMIGVCQDCLKKAEVDPKQIKTLKQLNSIISVTEKTDGNIKECIQSLTEILEDLERGMYGKEEKQSNTI